MILTYHSIDASGSPISVAPDVFRSHIRWLATSGQRVVRLNELSVLPDDADAMALTFDDGFANFAGIAAPLLLEAGLSATVFIVTDRAGLTNEWSAAADEGLPVL
ncbi:MAG: polysaccharide deacetylase family protein, partial [Gemmatimonadaceae bacterium]